jgi:23S rRNA pseudouridine2605 synthase
MRLNLYVSKSGISSRRKADELIFNGEIKVNNLTVNNPGIKIDENKDLVMYKNKILKIENFKYFVFNKPVNVVTTVKDPQNRKTVIDFFKQENVRLFPVGRLDYDSSGLLFMTNDGDFSNKLMHPSNNKNKIYLVDVDKELTKREMEKFRNGINIEKKKTSNSDIKFLKKKKRLYTYEVTIHEGINRQIRKMFNFFNSNVITLERTEIAGIKIGNLKEGKYRKLEKHEYNKLMEIK